MIAPTTTTITVRRPGTAEPHEGNGTPTTVASGVPAHIGAPSGSERRDGASQESITDQLSAEPVALLHTDIVVDDVTGATFEVVWVQQRIGLGLDHTVAGLRRVSGIA